MIVSRVQLKNWRNFLDVDAPLTERVFLVGPNASGKSNLLDALRFLRDICKSGGGLQKSVSDREGLSKIRCLAARKNPNIELTVELSEHASGPVAWRYSIGIMQEPRGLRQPMLTHEKVWDGNKLIIDRPNDEDKKDKLRLTQTYLEQINSNATFRPVAHFFDSILYLHLVPQLVKHPDAFSGPNLLDDPFGKNFLDRVAEVPEQTRRARLKKIESALQLAVPQLKQLSHTRDEKGIPHLEAVYQHWRPNAGKQREKQFSDGTLRLIALLWALMEGDSLLLLEEPELSLNSGIVSRLAPLIYRMQRNRKRQVILSTHSSDLLSDRGINPEEVLMLIPDEHSGTTVKRAENDAEVIALLGGGMSIAEAILPKVVAKKAFQLEFFE